MCYDFEENIFQTLWKINLYFSLTIFFCWFSFSWGKKKQFKKKVTQTKIGIYIPVLCVSIFPSLLLSIFINSCFSEVFGKLPLFLQHLKFLNKFLIFKAAFATLKTYSYNFSLQQTNNIRSKIYSKLDSYHLSLFNLPIIWFSYEYWNICICDYGYCEKNSWKIQR